MNKVAITGRKLSEFFPKVLAEDFESRYEPPKEDKINRRIVKECAALVLMKADSGIGRKRPRRKCRCKLSGVERIRRTAKCRELGKIAHQELLRD